MRDPIVDRKPDENDFEYGLRLCKYKWEEKPDYLDWQDIVDLSGLD